MNNDDKKFDQCRNCAEFETCDDRNCSLYLYRLTIKVLSKEKNIL